MESSSKKYYFLTHAQKRIWYTEKMYPGNSFGNLNFVFTLQGNPDIALLEKAINLLLLKNDGLRIRIIEENGDVKQYISGYTEKTINISYYTGLSAEQQAEEWLMQQAHKPFDLLESDLFYFAIIKINNKIKLLMKVHHLIIDVWGISVAVNRIFEYYRALAEGQSIRCESCRSYIDYIISETNYKNSPEFLENKSFWNQKFSNLPEKTDFKIGNNNDPMHIKANRREFLLTKNLSEEISAFCRKNNTSIFKLFLSALSVYIYNKTSVEDIIIGTAIHNRFSGWEKEIVGMFVSTIPFRIQINRTLTFTELLKILADDLKTIINNQKYPYDLMIKDLREKYPERPDIHLFNLMLSYQNAVYTNEIEHVQWNFSGYEPNALIIHVNDRRKDGSIGLEIDYQTELFTDEDIITMQTQIMNILQDGIKHPSKKLVHLEKTSAAKATSGELKNIEQNFGAEISDLYPLSPAQREILYNSVIKGQASDYFVQWTFDLYTDIDINLFNQSLAWISGKHSMLRTVFSYKETRQPLQIVLSHAPIHNYYEDISHLESKEQAVYLEKYRNACREKGIDLFTSIPFYTALFKLDAEKFKTIWSFHKIITDNNSFSRVLEEFFGVYSSFKKHTLPRWEKEEPYSSYVNSLGAQHDPGVFSYWEKYLEDYENSTQIPFTGTKNHNPGTQKTMGFSLDCGCVNRLLQIAGANRVEWQIVLQAVWAVLMQKYNNTDDIVFGVSALPEEAMAGKYRGLLSNILPVRVRYPSGMRFAAVIKEMQLAYTQCEAYGNCNLHEIKEKTGRLHDFPDHALVFEYDYTASFDKAMDELGIKKSALDIFEAAADCFHVNILYDKNITIRFNNNKNNLPAAFIKNMEGHLKRIIHEAAENPDIPVKDMDILTIEEKELILNKFNAQNTEYPHNKTIHRLFEERAAEYPDSIALVYNKKTLTYTELNNKANRLAWALIHKGVKTGSIVGVMTVRSFEMLIGIYAVLKAGAAYLPIGCEYPEDRIRYITVDSRMHLLITAGCPDVKKMTLPVEILDLEDENLYRHADHNPGPAAGPGDLAYIIYTSGSTGNPKGVMIEHTSAVNILIALQEKYPLLSADAYLLKTTYTFDVSVAELFGWFHKGGKLVILEEGSEKVPEEIAAAVEQNRITHINFVPSMFNILFNVLEERELKKLEGLKYIFIAGEAILPEMKKHFMKLKNVRFENIYGPTESTIYATSYSLNHMTDERCIPIGKPLPNIKAYILNKDNQLQPVGVMGELCLAGTGLARGYLNALELTAKKFTLTRFHEQVRIYRTGDLARWREDGNIEFFGRIDHQVKIRGFRIELGEIETCLLKHEAIQAALVTVQQDVRGNNSLCAYYVPHRGAPVPGLREFLMKDLPDYMLPAYFIRLENFPLTGSGKINRKALPKPQENKESVCAYENPRNEMETTLIRVWQDVLGVKKIGRNDNFFSLGGDSIKAIQISAKLRKHSLLLNVRDYFKYSTVAELVNFIKANHREIDQGLVTGEIPLTPIQKWFFETKLTDKHFFNHSLVLHYFRIKFFDIEILRKAFTFIAEHHDVLRMVFTERDGKIIQYNRGLTGDLIGLAVTYLTDITVAENNVWAVSHEIQSRFDMSKGPLLRLIIHRTPEKDYLEIIVHHLIIDGISWRILVEDFFTAYFQLSRQEPIKLADKTDSFKAWSEKLQIYADSSKSLDEKAYWINITNRYVAKLPRDHIAVYNRNRDADTLKMFLTEAYTEKLLMDVNKAYGLEINTVLLTALGLAVKQWSGNEEILINLEGHGREDIIPDIDITRTVGWFTSAYPVILDMSKPDDLPSLLIRIKEHLRNIPNKGIGYGVLKYLTRQENKTDLNCSLKPEITFNYLGQFDKGADENELEMRMRPFTETTSPDMERDAVFEINGIILKGKLEFSFNYNRYEYDTGTVLKFIDNYKSSLITIIDHCAGKTALTPHLSGAATGKDKQRGYPLTPMQTGILYHTLTGKKDSGTFFIQLVFAIHCELDTDIFKRSFQLLAERHDIFRTVFSYDESDNPIQIVRQNSLVNFHYTDLTCMERDEQTMYVEDFIKNDRAEGFDIFKDELTRCALCKFDKQTYKVIWSFHHMIIDGWCLSILLNELFRFYRMLRNKQTPAPGRIPAYRHYIDWLYKQDKIKAQEFWKDYLSDYDVQATVPVLEKKDNNGNYIPGKLCSAIDAGLITRLRHIAGNNRVTLNTVFQAIWGILLQRYNCTDDVVFGTVVSGRAFPVEDIDKMLGLFINTIPVRVKNKTDLRFSELIRELQQNMLLCEQYSYFPLYDILKINGLQKNLIDHILAFENYPVENKICIDPQNMYHVEFRDVEVIEQTNYDFNMVFMLQDDIVLEVMYNAAVYDAEYAGRVTGHFIQAANAVAENPEIRINAIDILTDREKEQILAEFNATKREYPQDRTIQELFEEQVRNAPDFLAVSCSNKELSYSVLSRKADFLAYRLQKSGVGKGSIVGIITERSLSAIIGLLAIVKAGGAYLPIDYKYPIERIQFMMQDSGMKILLTQHHLQSRFDFDGEILFIEDEMDKAENNYYPEQNNTPESPAYVIYTSGTTGKPKGVIIRHRHVAKLVKNVEYLNYECGGRMMQTGSISFDASTFEIWGALLNGMSLFIVEEETVLSPRKLSKYLQDNGITCLLMTPALFNTVSGEHPRMFSRVKNMLVGGDILSPMHINKVRNACQNLQISNAYGPTENTVISTCFPIDKDYTKNIPIGRPVNNSTLYIVDRSGNLQPVGIPGEICVGGEGVSEGYLNRPELTKEKFVHDPFINNTQFKNSHCRSMYKTGDMGRWLPDGNVEFIARFDNQVKIRGFRIELEEIENTLLQFPDIKECVVLVKGEDMENKYLVGYYIAAQEIEVSAIVSFLSNKLPDYMIPRVFMHMDKFPLNAHGKLDKAALPFKRNTGAGNEAELAAPVTKVQNALADIWKKILSIDRVGIHNSFFESGGNSLHLIFLHREIEKVFPGKVDIADLFAYPTIALLAMFIEKVLGSDEKFIKTEPLQLPDEYFVQNDAYNENSEKKFELGNDVYRDLRTISEKWNIELYDILLSGFLYLLSQISGKEDVTVYTLEDDESAVIPVSINFCNVEEFLPLFELVKKSRKNGTEYSLNQMHKRIQNPDSCSVIPLFALFRIAVPGGIEEVCDILLKVHEEENSLVFGCEFNSAKLKSQKVNELIYGYIKVIRYLTNNILSYNYQTII